MAVMAIRQFYRVNAWLENISLTMEREMFLEEGLAEIHGPDKAERIELRMATIETKIMKMIERVSNEVFRVFHDYTESFDAPKQFIQPGSQRSAQ